MTIESYLNAKVVPNYDFSNETIEAVLLPRTYTSVNGGTVVKGGTEVGTDYNNVSQQDRDLSEAELWLVASGIMNGGGESKTMGNRRITSGSVQTSQADREEWRKNAQAIWDRYGIINNIPDPTETTVMDRSYLW